MERNRIIGLCLLIFWNSFSVNCEYFSVVGSKTLRINEPYSVAVTSHFETGANTTISVGIQGLGTDGTGFQVFQDVTVAPGETKITELVVRARSKLFQ